MRSNILSEDPLSKRRKCSLSIFNLAVGLQEVGCDRALLSQKYYDRCRVCDGDGSTCKLIQNTYTAVHRKRGWYWCLCNN